MSEHQALLQARDVSYSYGAIRALSSVTVYADAGEAICIIGPNGAGKTTLARVLGGLFRPSSGSVQVNGKALPRRAYETIRVGVGSVLEGRRLFVDQTVRTNLELGCYSSRVSRGALKSRLDDVLELFPALEPRLGQLAGTMSGGEQQMIAIARALMSQPQVLILDEPSMGLAPKIASGVFQALQVLQKRGLALVLIEQNAPLAFKIAQRGYLIRQGSIVVGGPIRELEENEGVRAAYLGP